MIANSSRSPADIELLTAEVNQLLDITPEPSILVSNSEMQILAANAAMAELSGYTRRELLSLHLETILPDLPEIKENESSNLELNSTQGMRSI